MTTIEKTNNYNEAIRYLENAVSILKTKAKKEDKYYTDAKYVRMACGTAYSGVLLALDTYLSFKGKGITIKPNRRKSVEYYRGALTNLDKKLLTEFNVTYNILLLDGYYEGITKFDIIKSGLDSALTVINKIRPHGVN